MDAKKKDLVDLFGNKVITIPKSNRKKPKILFDDYAGFVDKFEPKKTTDDCYTPPEVYDIILDYVRQNCDITGREIVRPFYPGGDYEDFNYPDGCVVIDNPPFSIVSKIARFYIGRGIGFFLFAPHLTLFSVNLDCTRIVSGANIIYENGALVRTSFHTNLFGGGGVIGDTYIYEAIKSLNASKAVSLPKYEYPPEVLTVSKIQWCIERGVGMRFDKNDLFRCSGLDSQKLLGKSIFGGGFLLSEKAAAEKAAAEKAAAEKENVIEWELSDREKNIIKGLG